MKKVFYLIVLVSAIFSSCTKTIVTIDNVRSEYSVYYDEVKIRYDIYQDYINHNRDITREYIKTSFLGEFISLKIKEQ